MAFDKTLEELFPQNPKQTKDYIRQLSSVFIYLTLEYKKKSEELKNLENQILGAEERVINLEYNAFTEIRNDIEEGALLIGQRPFCHCFYITISGMISSDSSALLSRS